MTQIGAITGLNCPNCGGQLTVPEGQRVVACPFCQMRSLVAGERGVYRYQVARRVTREQALGALTGFYWGINKAPDLRAKARLHEMFPIYLPYWHARVQMAGWLFGKVLKGSDKHKRLEPVEVRIAEEMVWDDAACDVSEFGVQAVRVGEDALQPYDPEALRAEGMVFEPVESAPASHEQARRYFEKQARQKKTLNQKSFEKFYHLREQLSLVFYPLWVARYAYRGRIYQAVVDGVRPRVLYGKAPGNIFYRAAMLVLGMALGNCILVNGTLAALAIVANWGSSNDDNPLWLVAIPLAIGLGLIYLGYRAFRFGDEVITRDKDSLLEKSPTQLPEELGDMGEFVTKMVGRK